MIDKQILAILHPFQSFINIHPDWIRQYLKHLKNLDASFQIAIKPFLQAIEKLRQQGWIQVVAIYDAGFFVQISPSLKRIIQKDYMLISSVQKQQIVKAFILYYNDVCLTLNEVFYVEEKNPTLITNGTKPLFYEHANMMFALTKSLAIKQYSLQISACIAYYFREQYRYEHHAYFEQLILSCFAKEKMEEVDYAVDIVGILDNIASNHFDMARYQEAQNIYIKAIKICERNKDIDDNANLWIEILGTLYLNVGNTYSEQQEYVKAEQFYHKSLAIFQQKQSLSYLASIYQNLGHELINQGKIQQAQDYL